MNMNAYQYEAGQTAVYPAEIGLAYVVLGLTGEAGEIANKVKKVYRDDGGELTDEKRRELVAELGDVLWYAAQVANELGVPLSAVAAQNIEKLSRRQQRGTIQGSGDER